MRKILIIDNEESILEAIRFILSDAGYAVETRTGIAISQIKKNLPDLILLDMRLSGKDGRIIAKELKRDIDTKHIPIILISASPIKSAKDNFADAYIPKPFDIDFLLKNVKKYVGRER